MADLYNSDLGGNTRKAVDSTTFGTRDLVFLQIDAQQDIETGYTASGSVFAELIQCLQQSVEIYGVGIPNGQEVTVVVNRQSVPFTGSEEANAGGHVTALEDLLDASATFSSVNVYHGKIDGWNIQNDC
jgi:hypothetical protein